MLSWLFKRRGGRAAPAASGAAVAAPPPSAAERAQSRAETRARQVDDARTEWSPRLSAAQGNDAALLQVALAAPLPDIRLAAVEAIAGEELLRQAEREFRSRDRRVHSSAKRRLDALVWQREARARAQALIASAQALTTQPQVPVNHLVALDRDWQALAAAVEPAQRSQFSVLREQIDQAMQARDRQQQDLQRWTVEASRVLTGLQAACAEAAAGGPAAVELAVLDAAQALRETCPDAAAGARLDQALAQALQTASALAARLHWLAASAEADPPPLPTDAPRVETDRADEQTDPDLAAGSNEPSPVPLAVSLRTDKRTDTRTDTDTRTVEGWRALPPLPDAALARLMDQQFAQWLRLQAADAPSVALMPAPPKAPKAPRAPARPARSRSPHTDERLQLGSLLDQAEACLADGQLGGLQQHLAAFEVALDAMGASLLAGDSLSDRHQALLAERARLKGWQQWGGGQAREGLVAEAEALARLTLAATDPETLDAPTLPLKPQADAIQSLRMRWRELDRLGAAAPQALWQRFDAALHTAYQPLAAKQALLKAARQDNLAAREALLDALDALPAPGVAADPGTAAPADDAGNEAVHEAASNWKETLRALDRFHTAWRQLGPLEHTVPAAARDAVLQRLRSSLERVEQPVLHARQVAEAVRERMISHAQSLLAGPDRPLPPPDALMQARALQFDWQQHARTLPLARGVENALWVRFKTAIDAVYGQREAALRARDAELDGHLAEREALLQRLAALAGDSASAAERERGLAEIDRAWRQPAELARAAADRLDARFREARAAVVQGLVAIVQRQWQAQCQWLADQLVLCDQREQAGVADAELAGRWADQPVLPGAWGTTLAQRWAGPVVPGPLREPELDGLLLQLEAALELPATPEQQAARQQLKLLAMKDKFEGRASARPALLSHADALVAMLRQRGAAPAQRGRLQAVVAALGRGPAGVLGSPVARS